MGRELTGTFSSQNGTTLVHFAVLRLPRTLPALGLGLLFLTGAAHPSKPIPARAPRPMRSDVYVSTAGSNANDGSIRKPWRTISYAATIVKPGMTVHVASGEYRESIKTTVSGTPTGRIRFISDRQWEAKVVGFSGEAVWLNRGDYIDIVGFDITGQAANGIENLGSYNRILNNRVHDIVVPCTSNGGSGINDASEGTGTKNLIDGNFIYNIGGVRGCAIEPGAAPPGIYLSTPGATVTNNLVVNVAMGMQEWHDTTNEVVVNNTFICNKAVPKTYGIIIGAGDYPCNSGTACKNDNSYTANNITCGCTYGIEEEASAGGSVGSGNRYMNNVSYADKYPLKIIGGGFSSGNLTSNPQFERNTGDATGDYHLQVKSPAIDAGVAERAPTVDFSGGKRPQAKGFDIGAFEMGATAATWPWQ